MAPTVAFEARRLARHIIVATVLIVALYGAVRSGLSLGPIAIRQAPPIASPLIGDVAMLLLVVAIFWLVSALHAIGGGMFSPRVIQSLRQFATWLLIMALFRAIAPAIFDLASLTGQASRGIFLIIDIPDILLVGITYILFLMTRLLEHARTFEDDVREII